MADWCTDTLHTEELARAAFSNKSVHGDVEVQQRTRHVGGNVCDFCHKTLKRLGVVNLDKCSRCQKAYYCSKESQHGAWKAGHKQACRKPGKRNVGDLMSHRELGFKVAVLVKLVALDREDEGRWLVRGYLPNEDDEVERKICSIRSDTLTHIRPAK
jgi:hypothetical protein